MRNPRAENRRPKEGRNPRSELGAAMIFKPIMPTSSVDQSGREPGGTMIVVPEAHLKIAHRFAQFPALKRWAIFKCASGTTIIVPPGSRPDWSTLDVGIMGLKIIAAPSSDLGFRPSFGLRFSALGFLICLLSFPLTCLQAQPASPTNHVLELDGTGGYVELPPNILNDLTEATVEA